MKKQQKNHRLLALVGCMGSLLILPMQSFNFSISPKAVAQQPAKQSQQQLQKLAQSITVKILSGQKGGSGILLKKQGSIYTVLTSKHVLDAGKSNLIQTADNRNHKAEIVKQVNFGNQDLVLLQFNANANYTVASVGNSSVLKEGDEVLAAGFPFEDNSSEARQFVSRSGRVSILLGKKLQGGYQIGYTSDVEKGMSGGPLLNMQGQLVGINGIIAQPLWGNPYVYEDGTQPNDTLKQRMKSSSWGVPTQLLAKLAPQFVPLEIAQQVPTEVKTSVAPTPLLTNQVDRIAKEITVLIGWSGGNGSGAIVAKEGNTYYVLTAQHVASGNRQLKVFTPDGKEYPVDVSKVKTWEGVDLALLEFTSNETYQVATLTNSSLDIEDQVIFVSGFPESKQVNDQSRRQFSAGFLLNWGIARNRVRDDRSFSRGYELVYTNITAKGMSGGPVLDTEGRLIGIHAATEAVEGEKLSPIEEKTTGSPKLELGYSLGIPIHTLLSRIKQENTQLNFKQNNSLPKQLTASEQDEIVRVSLNLQQPESNSNEIEWLNFGNKLWRLRQYEQAEQAFEKAIRKKPDFYEAWYAHGMALIRQEKYKQAITSFQTAIKYNRKSDQAWRQLSDAFYYSGEYEEARKALISAINLRPDDFILYNWQADSLSMLGRYPEALKVGNKSIEINPNISESYTRRAQTRRYLKDYSGAIADVNKALELQPDLAYGYQLRGFFRAFQKDYTGALADLKKAIDLKPKYFDAYIYRGTVYAQMGNRQKFIEDFNQALRLKPDDASIYSARANAFSLLGDTQKAIDDYTEAIRLSPEFAYQFYSDRGRVRSDKEDYKGAINDYTEALRFRPTYIHAYMNRGYAYAKLGKPQESLRDFDRALSLQPNNASIYSYRGETRFVLKDTKGAIDDFDTAIKIAPELAYIWFIRRGDARNEQKDDEGAVKDYSQAISLKPEKAVLAEIYYKRGRVRLDQKYYKEAIDDFDVAIQFQPDTEYGYAYGFRGLANDKLNNKQKAIEDLQKASQIFRARGIMASYEVAQKKILELQQQLVQNK